MRKFTTKMPKTVILSFFWKFFTLSQKFYTHGVRSVRDKYEVCNFGAFDDFGAKNDQKVSHNMILMSKYKGQHGGKRVKKFGQGPPPPFSGNARKKSIFFM